MEDFKTRLRTAMEEKRMRQVDLVYEVDRYCMNHNCPQLRISASLLNMYLKGKNEPTTPRILILAKILNVSEAWLIGFDVPKDRVSVTVEWEEKVNKLNEKNKIKLEAYLQALIDSQEEDK